jgi:hypothetical protein
VLERLRETLRDVWRWLTEEDPWTAGNGEGIEGSSLARTFVKDAVSPDRLTQIAAEGALAGLGEDSIGPLLVAARDSRYVPVATRVFARIGERGDRTAAQDAFFRLYSLASSDDQRRDIIDAVGRLKETPGVLATAPAIEPTLDTEPRASAPPGPLLTPPARPSPPVASQAMAERTPSAPGPSPKREPSQRPAPPAVPTLRAVHEPGPGELAASSGARSPGFMAALASASAAAAAPVQQDPVELDPLALRIQVRRVLQESKSR